MTLIVRPAPNTRRVAAGQRIRARDQNGTFQAIAAIQRARNALVVNNRRAWAEQMLLSITSVENDYLVGYFVWRDGDLGTTEIYVARPRRLRAETSRDGVTYNYNNPQERVANKSGEDPEVQQVTTPYLVGDVIEVTPARSLTGITIVDEQRRPLIDNNVDSRVWAAVPT